MVGTFSRNPFPLDPTWNSIECGGRTSTSSTIQEEGEDEDASKQPSSGHSSDVEDLFTYDEDCSTGTDVSTSHQASLSRSAHRQSLHLAIADAGQASIHQAHIPQILLQEHKISNLKRCTSPPFERQLRDTDSPLPIDILSTIHLDVIALIVLYLKAFSTIFPNRLRKSWRRVIVHNPITQA